MLLTAAALLFACSQEGGQPGDLSKKAPPSLGAIANVDGSDDTKKEGDKPPAGTPQAPAPGAAAGQSAPAAPKQ
jgi:hypothetical protein